MRDIQYNTIFHGHAYIIGYLLLLVTEILMILNVVIVFLLNISYLNV
jgi:hypothetical protein